MENTEKVIVKLIEWKNDESFYDGGIWWGYATLSAERNILVRELKTIMKTLREKKIVSLVPLVNEDNQISGRGYLITDVYYRQITSSSMEG